MDDSKSQSISSDFDWPQFLDLARRLFKSDPSEAAYRTAVSRAYYAAHHRACAYLRNSKNVRFSGHGKDHDTAIDELKIVAQKPGHALRRLRAKRTTADYERDKSVSKSDVDLALSEAQQIMLAIDRLETPPALND